MGIISYKAENIHVKKKNNCKRIFAVYKYHQKDIKLLVVSQVLSRTNKDYVFSRPGPSQWMAYKHLRHLLIDKFTESVVVFLSWLHSVAVPKP